MEVQVVRLLFLFVLLCSRFVLTANLIGYGRTLLENLTVTE